MIQAKGIRRKFGQLEVLRGVDLEVSAGEVVSIVGPSGAGKSTLLQIIGTLDQPTSGSLTLNQMNPFQMGTSQLAKFRNQNIGFVFQFHNLLAEFNAIENVMIPALIHGVNKSEAEQKAKKWLERLGLNHRLTHKPSELSGGEQQRVSVARALINDPNVILADEPSGNLDKANANQLHHLFFELRNELGNSFVIVTHNDELASMADRKIQMADGLILPA
jgi:lipoprotein-releasing system ATP-binding protein